jgi:hypothetical protein
MFPILDRNTFFYALKGTIAVAILRGDSARGAYGTTAPLDNHRCKLNKRLRRQREPIAK